jgi:hypothetical protein
LLKGRVSAYITLAAANPLSLFTFDMAPIDAFRYRCMDALRAVTGVSVKEARLKDIKNEIINSEKLKVYFIFYHSHILKTTLKIYKLCVTMGLYILQKFNFI